MAVIALFLCIGPAQLGAASDSYSTRLSGEDRIATAIEISYALETGAKTVILAPSNQANLFDALAAAPFAAQEEAPILLTPVNSLDARVKARILELGVSKVYVIGAISDRVAAEVEALPGVTAVAIKGSGRCETAAAINALLTNPQGCFVVGYNALPDALSVASYAAQKNYAIIVADSRGKLPKGQQTVGQVTYILGGPHLVDNSVSGIRLYGSDRFETNLLVSKMFSYSFERVYVANGYTRHLADALAAAPLAARYSAFIALADNLNNTIKASSYLNTKVDGSTRVIAVGGASIVPDSLAAKINMLNFGDLEGEAGLAKALAPDKVEFKVNTLLDKYDSAKISLTGNLVTKDGQGQLHYHPKAVEIVKDEKSRTSTVTLYLHGNVADTSFKAPAKINLAAGAFLTVNGQETAAQEGYVTSFVDYSPPARLTNNDAVSVDEDGDGELDGIMLTYSEALDPQTVTISDYEVYAYTIYDLVVDGNKVLLKLTENGYDALPTVTQIGEVADNSPQHNVLKAFPTIAITDRMPPKVNGVKDGAAYDKDVLITFREGTAKLTKDGAPAEDLESGTLLAAEGKYSLELTDYRGNKAVINFVIDKTKPRIERIVFAPGNNLRKIVVLFSEAVMPVYAENLAVYELIDQDKGGVKIISAAYNESEKAAYLTLNGELAVNDVLNIMSGVIRDSAGNIEESGGSYVYTGF